MGGKYSLRTGIDRDVYQIVRKIKDEVDGPAPPTTVWSVYEYIRKSNSSLSRQKRKPLEESIERVLRVWKRHQEEVEDDEEDDQEEEAEDSTTQYTTRDSNLLNRQLVRRWQSAGKKVEQKGREEVDKMDSTSRKRPRRSESREGARSDTEQAALSPEKRKQKPRRQARPKPAVYEVSKFDENSKASTVGGISDVVEALEKAVPSMLHSEERFAAQGLPGLLLHGPKGCGKFTVIETLARKWNASLVSLSSPRLVEDGRTEKILVDLLDEVKSLGRCVVHFRWFDAIWKSDDSGHNTMCPTTAHLRWFLDDIYKSRHPSRPVVVIASTTQPEVISDHLFLDGVLQTKYAMKIPNEITRQQILEGLAKARGLQSIDYAAVARFTHGYVADDLAQLATRAFVLSSQHSSPLALQDFKDAAKQYTPHMYGKGFTKIPDITLNDVGGLSQVVELLQDSIIEPIRFPHRYETINEKPDGILLWGPPGCGKTFVAQAVANAAQAGFILVNGPELLDKYVGESERKIRALFERAAACAPCLIFLDEFDSLVPRRASAGTEVAARVVNTFLVELDGVKSRTGVYVVAATNRPDMMDPALLRPGRFSHQVYVDLPTREERADIMRKVLRSKHHMSNEEDLAVAEEVAASQACDDFSGADITALCRSALSKAIKRDATGPKMEDWNRALEHIGPSVDDIYVYRKLQEQKAAGRNRNKR